ncbi:MAG: hypothetical protein HHAS10_11490 [Candidatus Altimarinota bacterium]
MQFKAVCSKGNQKLTLSLSASNIDEARSLLHGQGYSIMEIQEVSGDVRSNINNGSNFFYFDAYINGQLKSGKIQSLDVFKAYKKLVDDLGYDILYIYTTEGMNEEQKKIITAKVKDGYIMYKKSMGINVQSSSKVINEKEEQMAEISPQVLRELEHYNNIIDSTIEKLQNLILKYHKTITPEKKKEFENIENILVQSKGSSNLGRIKIVVENALTTLGRVEADLIKSGVDSEKGKLLQETNSLLKQIGSSERIESGAITGKDLVKNITNFLNGLTKKEESKVQEKKKVDTNSFIFYKNLRELNIYKKNLNKVVIDIIKATLSFDFDRVKRLKLKKRLLEQDIQIIDNRIHNRNISYTKIIKGTKYYTDGFLNILQRIGDILLYGLFLYTFVFIAIQSLDRIGIVSFELQERFFLYITIISLLAFFSSFFRSLTSLFVLGSIFLVCFVFFSVNF